MLAPGVDQTHVFLAWGSPKNPLSTDVDWVKPEDTAYLLDTDYLLTFAEYRKQPTNRRQSLQKILDMVPSTRHDKILLTGDIDQVSQFFRCCCIFSLQFAIVVFSLH